MRYTGNGASGSTRTRGISVETNQTGDKVILVFVENEQTQEQGRQGVRARYYRRGQYVAVASCRSSGS